MGRQQQDETGFSLSPSVVVENHSTTDEGHENDSRKRLDVIREIITAFLLKIQSTLGQPRLQQDQYFTIRWRSHQGGPRPYMVHTYCMNQSCTGGEILPDPLTRKYEPHIETLIKKWLESKPLRVEPMTLYHHHSCVWGVTRIAQV
jgi:hypothetical protein